MTTLRRLFARLSDVFKSEPISAEQLPSLPPDLCHCGVAWRLHFEDYMDGPQIKSKHRGCVYARTSHIQRIAR